MVRSFLSLVRGVHTSVPRSGSAAAAQTRLNENVYCSRRADTFNDYLPAWESLVEESERSMVTPIKKSKHLKSLPKMENLTPKISVVGIGGAGCNAVNNMISSKLGGVDFLVCNTDSQSLSQSMCDHRLQLGSRVTKGLGAGSRPEVGRVAAEESMDQIMEHIGNSDMVFLTAGMGGGTGTGAAPVIASACADAGILTVGVVTKPFSFEGARRCRVAEAGLVNLRSCVDTLIAVPNQNLLQLTQKTTSLRDAFRLADEVLLSGVRSVSDLMVMPGLINLDFADLRSIMAQSGSAMMGTGEGTGDDRALIAAESAINNPLLESTSLRGAHGVLVNITGGEDITLFEMDSAVQVVREEADEEANIIFGSTVDKTMKGRVRVSVIATGLN